MWKADPQTQARFPVLIRGNLLICLILRRFDYWAASGDPAGGLAKAEDTTFLFVGTSPRT
jgi:hypothetical protein